MALTKDALAQHVAATVRKFKDRHLWVGASEIGLCARRTFFIKKMPEHIDPDYVETWGATSRGTVFENAMWVPAMRAKYGDNIIYSGEDQKHFKIGNLAGAPDGILINQPRNVLADLMVPDIGPSRCVVTDVKSFDPRIKLFEAKSEHIFQLETNLGLIRETSEYQPDYGIIIYVNASFHDDIIEFPIKFDAEVYAEAKKRADRIMAATVASELAPEGWIEGGEECRFCAYEKPCRKLRGDIPKDEVKIPNPQFLAEMVDLAREEKKWATIASKAEIEQRQIQHQIKERLKEKGLRFVEGSGIRIVWSKVKGRTSLDLDAVRRTLAKAGFEIADFEKIGEASDRLVISVSAQSASKLAKGKIVS